ncbi:MAG: tetratricopeptide repeat protein [Blastocatellia bacterium]|nr:tetratricopeptide repeat protein [Blastocatellia bacterium]
MGWQDREAVRQSEQQFSRGVELQRKGDLEGARRAYEAALALVPRRIDALSNLGVIWAKLERYDEAIRYYREALGVDPTEQAIRLNLGIAYFQLDQFEPARKELAGVVAAQPENLQARQLLGVCEFQLGKLAEAIGNLEKVHRAQPENISAAYVLGTAYLRNEQPAEGRVLIDKVFKDLPQAEGHLILGAFNAAVRKNAEAIEELKLAIKLDPRLRTAHAQLGIAYLVTGNRDLAIREFRAELENNPGDFISNIRLGWLLREDDRLDEAEPLLKRATELRPEDPAALFQYAQVQQARGRMDEAVALLERAIDLKKDYRQAYVVLVRLYIKQKRTADAQRMRVIIDRLNEEEQKRQPTAEKNATPPKAIDRPKP